MVVAGMTSPATSSTATPLTHGRVLVVFSGLLLAMLLAALDQTIVATPWKSSDSVSPN
jgi:hypothetical protein